MRFAVCINRWPEELAIPRSIERVNFHYLDRPWPINAPDAVVRQAFSNFVDPDTHDGPFSHDIEPPGTHSGSGRVFDRSVNVQVSAAERTLEVFPGIELWAYDPGSGLKSREESIARTGNIREVMNAGYAAGGPGIYSTWNAETQRVEFNDTQRGWQLDGFNLSKPYTRHPYLTIAHISDCPHNAPPGVQSGLPLFERALKLGMSKADIVLYWTQHVGPDAAKRINPYWQMFLDMAVRKDA